MDDHQLSYMIKMKKKKRKEKGWITSHKLGAYERLDKNKSFHSFKLHTYRPLMSCLVGKITKKHSHSFKLHIYRLLMSYLGV